MNLTRSVRYWDDLSVTQLLMRCIGHLKKNRLYEMHRASQEKQTSRVVCVSLCWHTISKSVDCYKCVRVQARLPVSGAIGCLEK